ncbi:MAG: zf-HC2 domain-containing protein [Rubrobacter sp.]|nr:zf-HC2 domain-containing protein [Rubrobacter sp.]
MSDTSSRHYRVRDLLGPYVLDALSPEEQSEIREHLRTCEACRAEERDVRQAHEYLTDLAATAEPPPPDLKDQIFKDLPRKKTRLAPLLAAAAAVIAFASLSLFTSGLPDFLATETATALEPTKLAPEASGELRLERADTNTSAELEVRDLPRTKRGEYYELWFGKEGGRVSAGTFTVNESGRATCSLNVPADAAGGYERVGITLEKFPEEPRMQDARVVLGGELSES